MEENAGITSTNTSKTFRIKKLYCSIICFSFQAQLKLADHLRKMGEQGRDLEGMDVDLDELRANLSKYKKFGFNISDLDWIDERKKIKAVTIFFYETSV